MVPEEPGDRDRKKWKTVGGGRAIVHDVPRSETTLALSRVYTCIHVRTKTCVNTAIHPSEMIAQVGSCFELLQKFPLRLRVNLNRFNLILLPYVRPATFKCVRCVYICDPQLVSHARESYSDRIKV